MPTDTILTSLVRRDWLTDSSLKSVITDYIEALRDQRYAERTIRIYLGCLAHFSFWLKAEEEKFTYIDSTLVKRFLREHLPTCTCPAPCYGNVGSSGAALRHLLKLLSCSQLLSPTAQNPVTIELARFGDYLTGTCGLRATTRDRAVQQVGAFLTQAYGSGAPNVSQLSATDIDAFFAALSSRLRPASLRIACNSLRSYFRYRALLGDATAGLAAALPRVADWRKVTLPKVLSDVELAAFLNAFDHTDPVGLRDYSIARFLLDLGLRGHEVAYLTLDSINWRRAMLTICNTKSKCVQQLPLPATTGEAVAQYLQQGRPQTTSRRLFVRHRAPFDKPLSVAAIRNSMNRAFVRCGLRDRFCNTHVLRRTMATRLQRSGVSIKEIADLLRHKSLDTASTYARVDMEQLRAVALPWPGSQQ
ncbi:site-specific integrase (plasmid) [Marinobacter sp. M3C]|uniref:tyrosine-type recombinase/integrase n=1 Tax=Marinobacter sp. M3C TaxID=2917715 RepID=UPI00200D28BA|nr:tyrosine-type recombinase/integrase [Marinobacter sp. M3C]UQG62706.1 site-specific integrase [Marinobacter sp. M3C]